MGQVMVGLRKCRRDDRTDPATEHKSKETFGCGIKVTGKG
jgi:hypothetical protein